VLDSLFCDWIGKSHVTDPIGDEYCGQSDIVGFYWANNPNDPTNYWMIERKPSTVKGTCYLYVDTNNNGNYGEHIDRLIIVEYTPLATSSSVVVTIKYADNKKNIRVYENQDWGESLAEGGRKVEFKATFADLGIGVGQTIRMKVKCECDDWCPNSGDIQWSPVSILGYPLLAAFFIGAVVFVWHRKGRYVWPKP
jgi:hypothetical protein